MQILTISPKYQVVIPKEIREGLGLKSGQKVVAVEYDGRIELIPVRSPDEMKGYLAGMDSAVSREEDRL
jgi:AbrB family looped-hinge helix DNA binding protein